MSIAKIIEISAESNKSFEDAIRMGVLEAAKSVRNIRSAWVNGQQAIVNGGDSLTYRVDLKVSFVVD